MNKGDLVSKIAEKASISKKEAEVALNATLDAIDGALKASDKVTLIGFGTFAVTERAARTGRNPRTGEELAIAAKRQVRFKPGKGLGE